ncbi:MAG: hypothetical protein HUJ98_08800 [Bacteroidaceae bacterium]|nr:hypothetical protein [Bacteroidaceae bacterium]
MLEEIAKMLGEESIKIAEREISRFKTDFPECEIDQDTKVHLIQMVNSQLTFKINELRLKDDTSPEEQFEAWLSGGIDEAIGKSCYHYLDDERKKKISDEDENLSFLERYLRDHKRGRK